MKKILLKAFMLLCLILWGGVSSAWAVTTTATMAAGANCSAATVNEKEAIKVGTSTKGGSMTITVPANSTSLTFFAAAWSGVSGLSLNITPTASVKTTSVALTADTGITGNSPFTLDGDEDDFKFTIYLMYITTHTTLTLTGSAAKRFVVWGATAEVVNTQTYTVTFDAGENGTCSTSSLEESTAGAGVTLPNVMANAGFNFVGWSTDATPSSASAGAAGETYHPLSDCTLYAYYTVARPAGEVFYESFDTNNGTGGNDDLWNGSIASSTFNADNTWTVASASGANKCAKFGTGSALGSAQTPEIIASGNFTLTFKAAAWNGNSESTTLKLSATGATLSASTVTLTKGAWETYNVNITNATEGFKIKFAGNATSNSRFFLDEVSIVEAAAPTTATITLNAACKDGDFVYGTYSNTSAWVVPGDILVSVIAVEGENLLIESFNTGDVVPANTGVLVSAMDGGNYVVNLSNEAGVDPLEGVVYENALRATGNGITAEQMAAADPGKEYFRLTMHEGTQCGFWWGAENGAAFALGANKAYLVADPAAGGARGFSFGDNTEALESIEMSAATTIYTLNGVKVNELQKGLNIVNGKKVMVK